MLFDEKIGGTIHIAIGDGFPDCGGLNESAIHWDKLCDVSEGEICDTSEPAGQNQASVLRFIIPLSINAGEYNIEIRNKPGNKLRKGQMEDSLTVAA